MSKNSTPQGKNESQPVDVFANAMAQLEHAYQYLDVSNDAKAVLAQPKEVVEAAIPVRMDNGSLRVFTGYRVRYNDARGPTKGGIRFHPNVTLSEVKALSFWMTIKTAVAGIPYGGSKGGVIVNPKQLSKHEVERLSRGYIRSLRSIVGPDRDVPAPDVYTTPEIMGWMADEYGVLQGKLQPAVITGKPIPLGGSEGRNTATAKGAFLVLREALRAKNVTMKDATIAIQGYGNAGYHLARFAHEAGMKVVAVSDSKGAIYNPDGLDPDQVYRVKHAKGSVHALYDEGSVATEKGCKRLTNDELLELDVDVLAPAALENVITQENASQVQAKVVLEVANGPTTPAADRLLEQAGVLVVPDVLANAGGVIVSYFEWVQNRQGYYWREDEVFDKLEAIIVPAFHDVYALMTEQQAAMRDAAFILAIKRIVASIEAKGREDQYKTKG